MNTTISGFRGRLDTLKSRGLSKVHDIQRVVSERSLVVRDGAKSRVARVQDSMRSKPALWAGVAAGVGFGLGLVGRIASARSRQRHSLPDLIIIESSC